MPGNNIEEAQRRISELERDVRHYKTYGTRYREAYEVLLSSSQKKAEQLEPCGCGGDAVPHRSPSGGIWLRCHKCGYGTAGYLGGGVYGMRDATAEWNEWQRTRTPPRPSPIARLFDWLSDYLGF